MSCTELHTFKLTPFKTVESLQEFINFARENKLNVSIYPNVEEYFDEYYITHIVDYSSAIALCKASGFNTQCKYVFDKNVIYKFDNYVTRGCEYVNKFIKNSDGSIDFVSIFYSGGTGFEEELQEGLDALLSKENKDECR